MQTLAEAEGVRANTQEAVETKNKTKAILDYHKGFLIGEELAIAYLILSLDNKDFNRASAYLCPENFDPNDLLDVPIPRTQKQGLTQAITVKAMEFSTHLIRAGDEDAGLWLLTEIPEQIQKILDSAGPLSLRAMLAPPAEAADDMRIYGQETGITLFDTSSSSNTVVVHTALESKLN
jgi:hypothetical protein